MIAIYGASGYTGRLVAAALKRRTHPVILAGRNERRLEELKSQLEFDQAIIRTASLDDPSALRTAFTGASAVINCAGPFARLGRPVVEAALDLKIPYCDTTGEQDWLKTIFDSYHDRAKRSRVCLLPAAGFDYVPANLAADVAAKNIQPLSQVTLAYAMAGATASRGTLRTALEQFRGRESLEFRDGKLRPAPTSAKRMRYKFPPPIGDRPVVPFPSGDALMIPRHVQTKNVQAFLSLGRLPGPLEPLTAFAPVVAAAARPLLTGPLGDIIEKSLGSETEGPSDQDRAQAEWMIVVSAVSQDQGRRQVVLSGKDPYGFTAEVAVRCAEKLAETKGDLHGAMTPSQVLSSGAFLTDLTSEGVAFEVR